MITEDKNIFSIGSRGDVVGLIQAKLKELGYELGQFGPNEDGIDNKYGPVTRAAVEDFQEDVFTGDTEKHDGIVGTDTWAELFPDEDYPLNVNDTSDISKNTIKSLNQTNNITKTSGSGTYPNLSGKIKNVSDSILSDIQSIAASKNWTVYISSGHRPNDHDSRHKLGVAVDIAAINGNSYNKNRDEFTKLGNELVDMLKSMGYVFGEYRKRGKEKIKHEKAFLWQTNSGGNHYNHIHASNLTGQSSTTSSDSTDMKMYRNDKIHLITKEINSTIVNGSTNKYPAFSWHRFKEWTDDLKTKNVFVSQIGYKETEGYFRGYKTPIDYTSSTTGKISYGFLWKNQVDVYANVKAGSELNVTIVDNLVFIGGYWGKPQPVIFTYFKLKSKTSDAWMWVPSTWVSLTSLKRAKA